MKKLLLAVSVFALIAPDIALAQQQPEPPRGGGQGRPAPGGRPDGGQARPPRPGGDGQPGRPGGPQIQPPRPGTGGPQIQPPRPGRPDRPQPPRPGNGGPQIQPPRPGNGGPQIQPPRPGRPQPGRPGNNFRPDRPHRPGAGRPPSFRPIRGPSFRYPRGYGYRRWSIGLLLPSLFLSNNYYYDDYGALGVGPPPPGYRWVRYGPDLLLVQRGSGRIADVIYGAFY